MLASKDLSKYIDWLRQQPLIQALPKQQGYMSHAGLPPQWTAKKAVKWASKVSEVLTSPDYVSFLAAMYGDKPNNWHNCNTRHDKLKFTVNALTRMRFCDANGNLDFQQKGSPAKRNTNSTEPNANLRPWFEFSPQRFDQMLWIFGHWAALMGETSHHNVIALDTGYVWGNYLSVMKLKTKGFSYIHHS